MSWLNPTPTLYPTDQMGHCAYGSMHSLNHVWTIATAGWPFVNGCREFRTALLVWYAQNQLSAMLQDCCTGCQTYSVQVMRLLELLFMTISHGPLMSSPSVQHMGHPSSIYGVQQSLWPLSTTGLITQISQMLSQPWQWVFISVWVKTDRLVSLVLHTCRLKLKNEKKVKTKPCLWRQCSWWEMICGLKDSW